MTKRIRRGLSASAAAALVVASALLAGGSAQAAGTTPPRPTVHTQKAYAPEDDFTAHWTRADAKQIAKLSDPTAAPRTNSMPEALTMPQVPQDFPTMTDQAYVWDTWPLTDSSGQTYSVDGYDVIFALTARAPCRSTTGTRTPRSATSRGPRGSRRSSAPRTAAGPTRGTSSRTASRTGSSPTSRSRSRPSGRDPRG
ncbi:hypothetical protein MAFF212519_07250 [Clavibacter michiganensis]